MRFQNLRRIEIKETSEISWPKQLVLEVEKHAQSCDLPKSHWKPRSPHFPHSDSWLPLGFFDFCLPKGILLAQHSSTSWTLSMSPRDFAC